MPKSRGRPRQFDESQARQAILRSFWEKGYAATSLDDLSRTTGMARPSLYGAFGSKLDMYLMSMDAFLESLAPVRHRLATATTPEDAIGSFLLGMIDAYFDEAHHQQLGCFLIGTAVAEAPTNPDIRAALTQRLGGFTRMLGAVLAALAPDTPPAALRLATEQSAATMHSLAIRARTGESRDTLTGFARHSARFIATLLEP